MLLDSGFLSPLNSSLLMHLCNFQISRLYWPIFFTIFISALYSNSRKMFYFESYLKKSNFFPPVQ